MVVQAPFSGLKRVGRKRPLSRLGFLKDLQFSVHEDYGYQSIPDIETIVPAFPLHLLPHAVAGCVTHELSMCANATDFSFTPADCATKA